MKDRENYKQMAEWEKYSRRHESNVFAAVFQDQEMVESEEINAFIADSASFFKLSLPKIYDDYISLAGEKSHSDNEYDILYNRNQLISGFINNRDAFKLVFTHEVCHHIFHNVRFNVLKSNEWEQELVCDYYAGIYSAKKNLATGKYKYLLESQSASTDHPSGVFRKAVFIRGREKADIVVINNYEEAIEDFLVFLDDNKDSINQEWCFMNEHLNDIQLKPEPLKWADLPDTNLIKQYILKLQGGKDEEAEKRKRKEWEELINRSQMHTRQH